MARHEDIIDEADALSQAGEMPSQVDPEKSHKVIASSTLTDEELCANGRPYPGGGMPPGWYKYDMTDDEWFGGPDD